MAIVESTDCWRRLVDGNGTVVGTGKGSDDQMMTAPCYRNDSDVIHATPTESPPLQYWLTWLLVFPAVTLVGNVLVCLSVYTERSLHTATNYFIVSLAIADIMVAILVMPFAVYNEVNNSQWMLGDVLCDAWIAFDVLCCTASILNLAAISFDRFVAITRPLRYAKHRKSRGRVYGTLVLTWIVSAAISSPIALGMNHNDRRRRTPHVCTFYNSDFLIFSSMGSFYIPCVIMLTLYWRMFRTIRQRAREAVLRKRSLATVNVSAGVSSSIASAAAAVTVTSFGGFGDKRQIPRNSLPVDDGCQAALLQRHAPSSADDEEVIATPRSHLWLQTINDRKKKTRSPLQSDSARAHRRQQRSEVEHIDDDDDHDDDGRHGDETELTLAGALEMLPIPCAIAGPSGMPAILLVNPPAHAPQSTSAGSDAKNGASPNESSARERNSGCTGRTADEAAEAVSSTVSGNVLDRWSVAKLNYFYARYLPTKRRDRTGAWRERKATKTLAIVLCVFLVCWAPFFTINIINAVCIRHASCDESVAHNTDDLDSSVLAAQTTLQHRDDDGVLTSAAVPAAAAAAAAVAECSDVCHINPVIVSSFVWLGYINSALNPIIYTIFNVEFRRAFDRLLRRPCRALSASLGGGRASTAALRGAMTAVSTKR